MSFVDVYTRDPFTFKFELRTRRSLPDRPAEYAGRHKAASAAATRLSAAFITSSPATTDARLNAGGERVLPLMDTRASWIASSVV